MNKAQLIDAIAEKAGLTKADSKKALEAFVATIGESLKKDEKVALVGFGSFSVSERSARAGRNPQTGKTENVYYKYDDDREGLVEIKNNNQKINIQSIFDDIIPIVTPGTYALGNLAADVQIAFNYYEQMKRANSQLISRYGRNTGAADHTDEYYHPLLQCHFGQMGDNNKINGLLLGYAKEAVMDYGPKRFKGIKHDEIMSDSGKDLYYNELGNKMGANNRNRPCVDLMDFLRTENMRNENIR